MLVLSRDPGERIMIGNDIIVTVVEIGRGSVKIGVDAPREIPVDRHQVHERKVCERQGTNAAAPGRTLTGPPRPAPAPAPAAGPQSDSYSAWRRQSLKGNKS